MPFPNVTSHRRMPHLPNTPKTPTTTQLPAAAGATAAAAQQDQQQADHGLATLPGRELENGSSAHRLTASSTAAGAGSSSQKLLQDSHHQSDHTALPASSSSSSISTLPGGYRGAIKDSEMVGGLMDQDRHYIGAASPSGALSLSSGSSPSASTSPSLTTHDSKMIKTALYDAFGVLYHPSAHTKHSLSTTAAALRSGDVTPLVGLSPKASPLLRPQYLGTSAPITPLELSEEASAAGYFGLHLPTSAASTSAAITGTLAAAGAGGSNLATSGGAGPSSSHQGHGHHHHYHHQHHHHHHPHRHTHTSSHLSATYTNNEDHQDEPSTGGRGYRSPLSRSRRTSVDFTLDPTEHPVLSSLQTLSITHPHPPEHYHPHLGHDLGHDRVPIAAESPTPGPAAVEHNVSSMKLTLPTTSSSTTSTTTSTTTTTTATTTATPLQHRTEQSQSSSPFPMDRGDSDSISGFGQQGLV